MQFSLWKAVDLFGSAAFVQGQDTYKNEPLPLVPPLNGRIGVKGPLTSYFSFECAATMFADQNRTASWEVKTPGYMLLDFYLTSQPLNLGAIEWRLFLGIENILD
jgi:outer membrane receptor protein involved in Fe transport